MKRWLIYAITNIAFCIIVSVLGSIICRLFGIDIYGTSVVDLFAFSLIFGFLGSFISLLWSKSIIKRTMQVRIINNPNNETEAWLLQTIKSLADAGGIGMPEVGIYQGEPNAFATGAFRNSSMIAVSTGLLELVDKDELKAILGHEVSHIVNGDMVTMGLLQGLLNTFVIFFARIIAVTISKALSRGENNSKSNGFLFYAIVYIAQIVLGILANIVIAAFSRYREYKADSGSVDLIHNNQAMINALAKIDGYVNQQKQLAQSQAQLDNRNLEMAANQVAVLGISPQYSKIMQLFASHPPMASRIEALKNYVPKVKSNFIK